MKPTKVIKTKYETKCYNCKTPIEVGTKVRWYKGKGVRCMESCKYQQYEEVPGAQINWNHRARRNVVQRTGR